MLWRMLQRLVRRGMQPQGVQIPLKSPLLPPAMVGGLVHLTRLWQYAAGHIFRSKQGVQPAEGPEAPGSLWSPLERPGMDEAE